MRLTRLVQSTVVAQVLIVGLSLLTTSHVRRESLTDFTVQARACEVVYFGFQLRGRGQWERHFDSLASAALQRQNSMGAWSFV